MATPPGKIFKQKTFRLLIIVLWLALIAALLDRDYFVETLDIRESQAIKRGQEESFQGIYFQNQRIGYVKNRLVKTHPDGFKMSQDAFMRLNILEEAHPITMQIKANLNDDLLLKAFDFHLASPLYDMKAQGRVEGSLVRITLTTGKDIIEDTIKLDKPPFLAMNQRAYLLERNLAKGEKIKVPYFDPVSLSGQDTLIEYRGKEKLLINGRIYKLHRFIESFSGLRINSWLDDQGKVIKEESPAGFVFLAEPEFKATDIPQKGREILSSVAVPLAGRMPDLEGRANIAYRLELPEGVDFNLDRDRQSLADDILTVSLEKLPAATDTACVNRQEELAPTPYLQSKNPLIYGPALDITKEASSTLEKVRLLTEWVYDNLEKRPVLGIPDALTTLRAKRGDCNEHAALFAAMARAVKIPARIAAGVVFHQGAFYYHAWNEVCVGGAWLSLDATRNQLPADITHIKFIDGEPREMIRIGALLGKLKIAIAEDQEAAPQ